MQVHEQLPPSKLPVQVTLYFDVYTEERFFATYGDAKQYVEDIYSGKLLLVCHEDIGDIYIPARRIDSICIHSEPANGTV